MKATHPTIFRDDPILHRVWEQLGRPSECRVTGGYLRDRLLGRATNDLDLTFDGDADGAAKPANRLAKALGVRAHLLGTAPHRVWRTETSSLKVELWPLGDLSHEEDIHRRDYSCNALSWVLPVGPLVDLVGGLDDLGDRRLRAISRANLESDPVRLLRGPRFLAQLIDFDFDNRTRAWIRELAPSLAGSPRERVGHELLTLLRGPSGSRGLAECLNLGLFAPAAPESGRVDKAWLRANLDAPDALNIRHTAGETPAPQQAERHFGAGVPPGPQHSEHHCGAGVPPAGWRFGYVGDAARLAFLFRAWGLPSERELTPYAWPKPIRENGLRATRLLDEARSMVDAAPADRRELAWRAGTAFPAIIALVSALEPDRPGWKRWWRQWRRDPEALESPQPLLSGAEIAEIAGIGPGPELGRIAHALLRTQVRGEVRTRRGAERWIRKRSLG